jgi:hypothetical protein
MVALLCFVLAVLVSPFKARSRLEAENAVLRHQLIVLRRKVQGRVPLTNTDRWFFIQLYRWFPSILQVLAVVRPETLVHCKRPPEAAEASLWSQATGAVPETRLSLMFQGRSSATRLIG